MKIFGKNGAELMKREIEVYSSVRHQNIIQLIGMCIQKLQFHLIMEFFDGFTLEAVLLDPERSIEK